MSPPVEPADRFGRPLRSLRVSVTDRCNLRCNYCMPEEEYEWLPRADILDFDEIERLVRVFVGLGVDRIRLTGGEPLLRKDLPGLVRQLRGVEGLRDLALTTNAVRLPELGAELRAAGLDRVTISLDTLRPDRFRQLTNRDVFAKVIAGLECAAEIGFESVKLNTVVMRGINDDEIVDLLEFARRIGAELRFIEYMDVGGATRWEGRQVVSRDEILEVLRRRFGEIRAKATPASAPASRFVLEDGTVFGVIASTTAPFCASCDRARLTADGTLLTCLYARLGADLRRLVRSEMSDAELRDRLARIWEQRVDRGAEQRLGLDERGALAAVTELRENPHLEMHKRGG